MNKDLHHEVELGVALKEGGPGPATSKLGRKGGSTNIYWL